MAISRREFIRAGAGTLAASAWVSQSRASGPGRRRPGSLVLIELNGGNDGLNTLIPYTNPTYYAARPTLAIPPSQVLKLSGDTGLHPSLAELAGMFHEGRLAIFRGVGHPNPSRSHFTSQQVWHTADPSGGTTAGWLAGQSRLYYCGPVCPQLFHGAAVAPVCLDASEPDALIRPPGGTGQGLPTALAERSSRPAYPDAPLARGLSRFAEVIAQMDEPAFFHIAQTGYDTHARQANLHAELLRALSQSVSALFAELQAKGLADETRVLIFSEFGRRLKENNSGGTDHGEASVVLLAGGGVRGGIHGVAPSLAELRDGGLRYTTDFRCCYAAAVG